MFYEVELKDGVISLVKVNSVTNEVVARHVYDMRGSSSKICIKGKTYSTFCSLLSLIMRNKIK